ncbi:B12-binding domain-containing radical SAM protein [Spirochaetia bacterium]|nr:B12-binding domain-containing radical SAM protein [Spirochaetia bacterium]
MTNLKSAKSKLNIVLAAVHLEEGPEAVPLGAACIASALKAAFASSVPGISVTLVETFAAEGADALIEKIFAQTLSDTIDAPGTINAIGFSLYSWNRDICFEAAAQIRRDCPDIFLFCGGPEATALPGGLHISDGGPFDAVIRGEGELAAVKLIGHRFFCEPAASPAPGTGLVTGTEPPAVLTEAELASLLSPWLDGTLTVQNRPGILWELARGCPYACAYCYESKGNNHVRYISEDRLQKELKLFVKTSSAGQASAAKGTEGTYVFVLDPTFNTDNRRALRILDMIINSNTVSEDIHWHFEVRGELLTREQARRFARLGASLQIGLQTADPKVSALINRSLEREKFASKINLLNEEGISFGLDLIYGLPGDTLAGYRKSLDFALSLYPNNLDLFRLSVLPGTILFEKMVEYGLKTDGKAPYTVISTPEFSAVDLAKAEKLSVGADVFYNRGRAVAWFNQVLYPLKMRPSVFLDEFTAWLREKGMFIGDTDAVSDFVIGNSVEIEKLQLAFLEKFYKQKKKEKLIPAVRDIIRYHGAWGRALAEGLSTDINFNYEPEDVLSEDAMDIESFVALVKMRPARARMAPGPKGPELLIK